MTNDPSTWGENPAKATAAAISSFGERWVYRHTCRCPACHAYWIVDLVAGRGEVDPHPDPVRIGMGLLCGRCEARRRALRAEREESGRLRSVGRWWGDDDSARAWGILRHNSNSYRPTVERLEEFAGQPLRDDRTAELERILGPVQSPRLLLSAHAVALLGLDWVPAWGADTA